MCRAGERKEFGPLPRLKRTARGPVYESTKWKTPIPPNREFSNLKRPAGMFRAGLSTYGNQSKTTDNHNQSVTINQKRPVAAKAPPDRATDP
jgi:hypothetical protein